MIKFPDHFWWGAATSAYQVEGGNANTDWWPWEKAVGHTPSGQACRHYDLYAQDFDLIKSSHHNAHRLSIEWSRVEPQEGTFSQEALQHYIDVILALRARGIEPMVTLHHFTNPIWMAQKGGWENKQAVEWFVRYSDYVVRALAPHVHFWMTINEPTIYASHAYYFGWWPPQLTSAVKTKSVHDCMVVAHVAVYRRICKIYQDSGLPRPKISIAQHIPALIACAPTLRNRLAVQIRDRYLHFNFLDQIKRKNALDFIGLNYYSRQLVDVKSWGITHMFGDACLSNHDPVRKNFLGWDIYPQGLYEVLLKLKKYNVPVMITENGICTDDDDQRWEFIKAHLESAHRAIQSGVNVTGYLYWSLMDNFEWDKGFAPRFGLIGIDYKSFQRTVRDSAKKFGEVCKTGILL